MVHTVIPALRRLSQGDHKFKTSLEYTVRFYFRNKGLERWVIG